MRAFTKKVHCPGCNSNMQGRNSTGAVPKGSSDRRGTRSGARQQSKALTRGLSR